MKQIFSFFIFIYLTSTAFAFGTFEEELSRALTKCEFTEYSQLMKTGGVHIIRRNYSGHEGYGCDKVTFNDRPNEEFLAYYCGNDEENEAIQFQLL
ncbi:MAG: hypothetical protein AB7I27_14855 [Bacteriovoracaceae bacterium]